MSRGPDAGRSSLDPQVFRAIAEFTYDWESWVDRSGRLSWVNTAVERITGYSVQECLAQDDYPLPIVHPEDRALVKEISRQAARGSSGNHVEFRVLRKDGTVRFGAISYQPIFDASGASLGYRSSVRDIEERKQMEERLRELVRQAEQANLAKTQFLANVSHELRTPLQALLSYAEILEQADIADEYRAFGRSMHQESQHLVRLVSDLLDYAALTGGDLSIAERAYSPAEEFEARLSAFHKRAQSKGLSLEWSLPQRDLYVRGDPDRALQILTNLTKNAIEYTVRGEVHVQCDVDRAAARMRIVVRDTGPGLPEGTHLFEPFRRGPAGDTNPGFGLGLAITSRLCERMGGSLKAGVAARGGALMVAEFRATEVGAGRPGTPAGGAEIKLCSVVVMDDVASVREALLASARALGVQAFGTDSLEPALDELTRRPNSLVLLDLNMPGVSVLESARKLRSRLGPRGQIIAMSASPLGSARLELEAVGVAGFLVKPIALQQLRELVRGESSGLFIKGDQAHPLERCDEPVSWDSARLKELASTAGPEGGPLASWLLARFQAELPKLIRSLSDPEGSAQVLPKVLHDLAGAAALLGGQGFYRRFRDLEEQALQSLERGDKGQGQGDPGEAARVEVAQLATSLLDEFGKRVDEYSTPIGPK